MKTRLAFIVAAALAVPMLGCEANIDADDDGGRAVGHARHDRDADIDIKADVPDVDVDADVPDVDVDVD